MFTCFVRRSLLMGGLLLSVMSAVASADTFTVNPGAIGVAGPTVQANFTDFSYVALVNQTATNGSGTFNEQGAGFFSSYRFPGLADVVPNAGINSSYKLYAVFAGEGTLRLRWASLGESLRRLTLSTSDCSWTRIRTAS